MDVQKISELTDIELITEMQFQMIVSKKFPNRNIIQTREFFFDDLKTEGKNRNIQLTDEQKKEIGDKVKTMIDSI